MSKQQLNIDSLRIRLKGVAPDMARTAMKDLGHELIAQLASSRQLSQRVGRIGIPEIDIGTVQLSGQTQPDRLQRTIARNIAASIDSKMKQTE